MKTSPWRGPVLLLALAGAASGRAAEVPVLSAADRPFRFVVLGDVHYERPDFKERENIAAIAGSVKGGDPPVAFVCQTGDIAEGGTYAFQDGKRVFRQAAHGEMKEELAFAVKDVTERFGVPLFIAVGNHDKHGGGTAFPEVVLPFLSRELGADLAHNWYGFRYGSACFVFLDFAAADLDKQRDFALEFLARAGAAPGLRHIFLFAHYPLWPLIRPGFSSDRFTESVLPIFKRFPVDAFFCGHTHNTAAWVRRVDGATLTQIQGVARESSPALLPMEERRTLLMPRDELSYYWGCLSGPPAGFFLVTVDDGVRVQFRSGAKVIREFAWREPGRIEDIVKPEPRPRVMATEAALGSASSATLVLCPWAEDRVETGISLNGERIASAPLGPTMRSNAFVNELRIPIPADKIALLRTTNTLAFDNPGRAVFAIGHAFIEARLADGRTARTGVSDRFLFSATEPEGAASGKTHGWKIIPPAALSGVALGRPLGPLTLRFPTEGQ